MAKMPRTQEPSGVTLTSVATTGTKWKRDSASLVKAVLKPCIIRVFCCSIRLWSWGRLFGLCPARLCLQAPTMRANSLQLLVLTGVPWEVPTATSLKQLCHLCKEHLRFLNPSLWVGFQSLTSVHCNHLMTPPWWPTFHCPSAPTLVVLHQLN